MKPVTIPAVLYMSLRTGLLVERPSHEGWTSGDVRQWEDEHEHFLGSLDVDLAIEEAGKAQRAENMNLTLALRSAMKDQTNLLSQVDQLMRENEALRQAAPRSFSGGPRNPFDFVAEEREAALMAEAKRMGLYGGVDMKAWPGSRK